MAYQFGVGEFETRDGRKSEVFAMRNGLLIGVIYHEKYASGIALMRWNTDGAANNDGRDDLMPPKQTRTGWVNIYPHGIGAIHAEKSCCDVFPDRLACVPITIEFLPGEGLE